MAWWWWVLLWLVLVLASTGMFFLLGRSLWRKVKILTGELAVAAERFGAASAGLQRLAEAPTPEPAVFTPSAQLRRERFLASRRPNGGHPGNS